MASKCFLYLDGYPVNASDVPYDVRIDWADGSAVESYERLTAPLIPPFYHVYDGVGPYAISVTLSNWCGTATKTVTFAPYSPEPCVCADTFTYTQSDLVTDFPDGSPTPQLNMSGCVQSVTSNGDGNFTLRTSTDMSLNMPLVVYPMTSEAYPDGSFRVVAHPDPPVADFNDSATVKLVTLDKACRLQQVRDGCFPSLDKVPKTALTLTVPFLMSAAHVVCTVPGASKALAVENSLKGPVSEKCPASILRLHRDCRFFLDGESAKGLL